MQKLAFIILMILAAIKLPAKEINTESWFPLQVGNTWFLRGDEPGIYDLVLSYMVVDTVRMGKFLYYDINPGLFAEDGLYRIDSLGNFIELENGNETLLCNLNMAPGDSLQMRINSDTTDSAFCYCRGREYKPSIFGDVRTEITYQQIWSQIYTDQVTYLHITDGLGLSALGKVWYDNPYQLIGAFINGQFYGDSVATAIQQKRDVPIAYVLQPVYPNPFNSQTTITFELDKPAFVELNIFDITGRHVQTLMSQSKTAGRHAVTWDAANSPSGIYLCELRAGENSVRRKIVLQK